MLIFHQGGTNACWVPWGKTMDMYIVCVYHIMLNQKGVTLDGPFNILPFSEANLSFSNCYIQTLYNHMYFIAAELLYGLLNN